MNWCSGSRNSTEDTRLISSRPALPEDRTHHHLAEVRILAFTYCIDPTALTDEAPHGRIFVPDVAKLHLGDLTEGKMAGAVLEEAEARQLSNQLARNSGPKHVASE